MKKLIMFLMVLAIGVPAPAIMVDESPPVWGGATPRCTYVWHIDTEEYAEPSCINFDTIVQDPVIWWGEGDPCYPTGKPVGTWNPDPSNGTFTFDFDEINDLAIYVEAPPGIGTSLTIRIQAAFSGRDPTFWHFPQMFSWDEEKGIEEPDWRAEVPGAFTQVGETDVWVMEETFYPERSDMLGSGIAPPGEKAIIGFMCEPEDPLSYTMTGMIIDVIRHFGTAPPTTGPGRVICDDAELLPIIIDPNVMVVYEEGETEGDFDVYLASQPFSSNVTIVIDPNSNGAWGDPCAPAGSKDIQLLDGVGADNQVTLTFNAGNWNVPQKICFKAINDDVPEPPELLEPTAIDFTMSHPTDPNFSGKIVDWVGVYDNDQANILFTITPAELSNPKNPVTGPVQIWEQPRIDDWGFEHIRWRNIGVRVQVPPLVGGDPCQPTSVKLNAEVVETKIEGVALPGGDNLPHVKVSKTTGDPCSLPYLTTDDPNGMIFTAGNYNVTKSIKIWGNDDAVLQIVEALDDGDEDYHADLVVTVIDDGGDTRYTGLERIVSIDIEDNECGAYGILPMDVSNPYYVTDPNWAEDDPDCHVDIHDIIAMAKRWINCSDPRDPCCTQYNL